MAVKLQGRHSFDAPRARVWQALLDPEVLARTLPGCEKLEQTGEHRFAGALNMKVGPVQGLFDGTVELSDVQPLEGYRIQLKGQGAPGFVSGDGTIRLEDGPGGTVLHYEVDAQVGGRIAGVGQRLLDSSAKVIARQAVEGLERQITARQAAAVTGEAGQEVAAPAPAAPSQAEFAGRFVKGLAGELVPPERRPWVVGAVVLLVAVVALLAARACGG